MSAKLVELGDGGARRRARSIRGELRIGRSDECEVVCDDPSVSRVHARIADLGERHTVQDAGSANGTRLNGEPLGPSPVLLAEGDEIEIADRFRYVYQTGGTSPALPRVLGAGVAIVAALALAAWLLRPAPTSPDLAQAQALAAQAVELEAEGDLRAAKGKLRGAAQLLYENGALDDVARNDLMRVAMQRLGESLEPEADLWALLETPIVTAPPVAPVAAQNPGVGDAAGCRLDGVDRQGLAPCLDRWIATIMKGLHQDPERVPLGFRSRVARRIATEHGFIARSIERGKPFVPMLRRELEAAHMPPLLHYVAMIESGYDPSAGSHAGAVGLWQFMPATGRRYALVVGEGRDDRLDPARSTTAAANYLRDLALEFGGDSLLLAMAGYNRGENGVRRALRRLTNPFAERSFWTLEQRELIPEETRLYVTRFFASAVSGEGGLVRPDVLESAGFGPVRR